MFEPSRLRCVRLLRGLSRRALAATASMHPHRLRALERRLVQPRGTEARRLAAALRVRPSMFDGPEVEFVHALAVNVTHRSTRVRVRARALAAVLGQIAIPAIEDRFERKSGGTSITFSSKSASLYESFNEGDLWLHPPPLAADLIRAEACAEHGPLPSVCGWLQHLGVWCFSLPPEMREAGAFSFWWGRLRVIVVPEGEPWRTRFDAAAQFGRLVLHTRGRSGNRRRDALEAAAFAETLLLPEAGLYAFGRVVGVDRATVETVARYYGVAPATALRRLAAWSPARAPAARALRAEFRARPIAFTPVRERPETFRAMAAHPAALRTMLGSVGILWSEWDALTFEGPWQPWAALPGAGEGDGIGCARLQLVRRRRGGAGRGKTARGSTTAGSAHHSS